MATFVEDIFSEGYLDEFYKAHVASRRSSLDEDIAAIEAEISKVHQYRRKFRRYRVEEQHLNSCGNSECSDDEDDVGSSMEMLPTSVFRVYNSTHPYHSSSNNNSSFGGNVFTWAMFQLVSHDHNYSSKSETDQAVHLLHDGINLHHVPWCQLTVAKRALALKRLSSILQYSPSSHHFSSLTPSLALLPHSLADTLRSNGGVVPSNKTATNKTDENLVVLNQNGATKSLKSTLVSPTGSSTSRNRRKTRPIPYERKSKSIEVTRIRNSSTCSENDGPLEVD